MPLSIIAIHIVTTLTIVALMLFIQPIAPELVPFAFLGLLFWLFYAGMQYKDIGKQKQPTEGNIQPVEPQHTAAPTQTHIPQIMVEPLKIASDSPWGSSPDVRSAREILFAHIAQERENLIERNASDEIIRYLDQFSARLAARFDKQKN